jgi:hypothetical protein
LLADPDPQSTEVAPMIPEGFSLKEKAPVAISALGRVTVTTMGPADWGPTSTWKLVEVALIGVGVWLPNATVMAGSKFVPVTVTVVTLAASAVLGMKFVRAG